MLVTCKALHMLAVSLHVRNTCMKFGEVINVYFEFWSNVENVSESTMYAFIHNGNLSEQ